MKKTLTLLITLCLGMFIIPNIVLAEGNRCTYTNYYFFSDINGDSYYTGGTASSLTDGIQTACYFPALEGQNQTIDGQGVVKLEKNGANAHDDGVFIETWEVKKLWQAWLDTLASGSQKNFTNAVDRADNGIVWEVNSTTRYIVHGNWFKIVNGERVWREGGYGLSGVTADALTSASFLPQTELSLSVTSATPYATVTRTIASSDYAGITGFSGCTLEGSDGNCMLTPALYKLTNTTDCDKYQAIIRYVEIVDGEEVPITEFAGGEPTPWNNNGELLDDGASINVTSPEYKNCTPDKTVVTGKINGANFEEKVTYTCPTGFKAIIRYYEKDSKGNKIEITKANGLAFDKETFNSKYSPYSKTGLENGYTETVTSPTIKNCKPDKSSVKVEIKNKDFEDEVIYTCTIKNENTGNLLIYLTFLLGFTSLGCSIYYFAKNKKEVNE